MASPQAFAELARAMHHARYREALALVDALIVRMPESASLRRQRAECLAAIERDEADEHGSDMPAHAVGGPTLIRVDATLFSFDQQRDCNAPAAELRTLGFAPLLDAASPAFSRRGLAPILIRFYGDESGDNLVIRFSAVLQQRPAQLLACTSMFSDGHVVIAQRDGDWPVPTAAGIDVSRLPQRASLVELVTRHVGHCATHLRRSPDLTCRPLRTLADCDRVWQSIAAN